MELPACTLGLEVGNWIEEHCVIPDGARMGDRYELTSEMWVFLAWFYAVDPASGRFVYSRGGQLVRPQKHGKGPFSAAIICAEAAGPVRFDRFEDGKVKGKAWDTPWIQVTAVSEDQTANVFRALLPMIQLSQSLDMEIADTGLTRINLPGGGYIEPVTSSARSRLGQRVTFCLQDETHSWVEANGGRMLADNQRRNLAGMGGRFMETTNAWDPAERSVAELTAREPGVYCDDAVPPAGSIRNKRERRRVMQAVYRDSVTGDRSIVGRPPVIPWIDLDRIDAEIEALLEHDPAQAERFFLNRKLASEGAAFDIEAWRRLAKPRKLAKGSTVVLGIDGARHDDAIAVVAADVRSGYVWPVIVIERPEHAGEDYEHDLGLVDGAVSEVFDRFNVWRMYCDDQYIASLIEKWQNRFGDKRVVVWHTNRPRPIAWAVRKLEEAIGAGDLSHDGNPVLEAHVRNSRRRKLTVLDDRERVMHTLCKDAHRSPRKIDAAMAAVLAWEARGDAISAGVWIGVDTPEKAEAVREAWVPGRAPAAEWLGVGSVSDGAPMGSFS